MFPEKSIGFTRHLMVIFRLPLLAQGKLEIELGDTCS